MRAERAEGRARAAGEIDNGNRRLAGERRKQRIQHLRIAGAEIVRLTQREPLRAEAAHASPCRTVATMRAEPSQVGRSADAARAPDAKRRRSLPSSIISLSA